MLRRMGRCCYSGLPRILLLGECVVTPLHDGPQQLEYSTRAKTVGANVDNGMFSSFVMRPVHL